MSEKLKKAINKLIEKAEAEHSSEQALQFSHAVLYLTQALHNIERGK